MPKGSDKGPYLVAIGGLRVECGVLRRWMTTCWSGLASRAGWSVVPFCRPSPLGAFPGDGGIRREPVAPRVVSPCQMNQEQRLERGGAPLAQSEIGLS